MMLMSPREETSLCADIEQQFFASQRDREREKGDRQTDRQTDRESERERRTV